MEYFDKVKQYGITNSVKRFFLKILRFTGIQFESYLLLENNLDIKDINRRMQNYDYSDVRELAYSDFLNAESKEFSRKKLELIQQRFKSGKYRCHGIFHNEKLIYSTWISFDNIRINSVKKKTIQLNKNQALLEDSYCHPLYRCRGLHSKMNLYRLKTILDYGYNEAVVVVIKDNIPALKTQLKDNFKPRKDIIIIKIFGREIFISHDIF